MVDGVQFFSCLLPTVYCLLFVLPLQRKRNLKKERWSLKHRRKNDLQMISGHLFQKTRRYHMPSENSQKDAFGYPDWTAAVRQGIIEPIDSLPGQEPKKEEEFNEDIIFEINDIMMPDVMFPHRIHNYWFSCKVCHSGIFKPKKGANDFKMKDNWDGNYCGRCHGKVAYAPKGFENCIRCHSVKR